jgi:hypothetical protein
LVIKEMLGDLDQSVVTGFTYKASRLVIKGSEDFQLKEIVQSMRGLVKWIQRV